MAEREVIKCVYEQTIKKLFTEIADRLRPPFAEYYIFILKIYF